MLNLQYVHFHIFQFVLRCKISNGLGLLGIDWLLCNIEYCYDCKNHFRKNQEKKTPKENNWTKEKQVKSYVIEFWNQEKNLSLEIGRWILQNFQKVNGDWQ